MNHVKLKTLADELATTVQATYEKRGCQKWNMAHFFSTPGWNSRHVTGRDRPTDDTIERQHMSVTCGTAACAGGWATAFFADLIINDNGMIEYEGRHNMNALALFFDLDSDEADALFLPEGYESYAAEIEPKDVAEMITSMLGADAWPMSWRGDKASRRD